MLLHILQCVELSGPKADAGTSFAYVSLSTVRGTTKI